MEVASPGLDRPLETEKDFLRVVGEPVLVTFKKEDGLIATWKGRVSGASADGFVIQLKDGAMKTVPFDHILHARRQIKINGKN